MKVIINKEFAGYKKGEIININENIPAYYKDVVYWLRRCEDGKIDGYCTLIEFGGKEIKKSESVIQSNKKSEKAEKTENKQSSKGE